MSFDYYVLFTRDDRHWWSRFLHPFFQHCYLVKPCKGQWLYMSRVVGGWEWDIVDDIEELMGEDTYVIGANVCGRQGITYVNTCVGAIKKVLGIKNPCIITPYQLVKRLRREKGHQKSASYGSEGLAGASGADFEDVTT